MHMVFLVLGVLCILVGIAPVLWGFDYPFDERIALMLRGTIAVIGGLVLIALGSLISHLRRIHEAIETLKLAPAFGATPAPATPDLAQAVVAEPDRRPPAESPVRSEALDLPPEREVSMPSLDARPARESPAAEWPRVDAADRFAPPGGGEGSGKGETPVGARAEEPQKANAEQSPAAAQPTILKSGVIEGIPYTAYSDGSFEAEFTDGTRRFGSFRELRMHFASRGIG